MKDVIHVAAVATVAAATTAVFVVVAGATAISSCASAKPTPTLTERKDAATRAVTALQAARFEEALEESDLVLAKDPANAIANAVWAVAQYRFVAHDLMTDVVTIGAGVAASAFVGGGGLNDRYLQFALGSAADRLTAVDAHLAAAAEEPAFALDLCLACWEVDWNRNGEIDARDRALFQVEVDSNDEQLPVDDPLRSPTFRFDVADLHWARAMIAFQRSVLNLALAYDLSPVSLLVRDRSDGPLTFKLEHQERVQAARELIFAGIASADASRIAALAETDDVREWVPNPRQKDHPLPLPVDEALFATWQAVLADTRSLIAGDTGLDVAALAQLGDVQWNRPPRGFLNIGKMLREPADITLDTGAASRADRYCYEGEEQQCESERQRAVEQLLKGLFGAGYVQAMPASGLIAHLTRVKDEVSRGAEPIERKLRYLLWLN